MSMDHGRSGLLGSTRSSMVKVMVSAARSENDEDEDAAAAVEYGDLLDTEWLEREPHALERDDELVDIGLTLDLDEGDDEDEENACVMELDVGTLFTSLLPAGGAEADSSEPELNDGALALAALREVLLPEELAARQHAADDAEVGDDERFPAFEDSSLPERPALDDDGSEGVS